mmetsp:Transcript_5813/g.8545  ORF Transcript_5813/g.8545 Transcript_5813/m.8545 type:complete len:133 (+) Transcript_5813:48-446(+)
MVIEQKKAANPQKKKNTPYVVDISEENMRKFIVGMASGYASGYVTKRYGERLFTMAGTSAVVVPSLAYMRFITIEFDNIKRYFGISNLTTQDLLNQRSKLKAYYERAKVFVKANAVLSISYALGFLAGSKLF